MDVFKQLWKVHIEKVQVCDKKCTIKDPKYSPVFEKLKSFL